MADGGILFCLNCGGYHTKHEPNMIQPRCFAPPSFCMKCSQLGHQTRFHDGYLDMINVSRIMAPNESGGDTSLRSEVKKEGIEDGSIAPGFEVAEHRLEVQNHEAAATAVVEEGHASGYEVRPPMETVHGNGTTQDEGTSVQNEIEFKGANSVGASIHGGVVDLLGYQASPGDTRNGEGQHSQNTSDIRRQLHVTDVHQAHPTIEDVRELKQENTRLLEEVTRLLQEIKRRGDTIGLPRYHGLNGDTGNGEGQGPSDFQHEDQQACLTIEEIQGLKRENARLLQELSACKEENARLRYQQIQMSKATRNSSANDKRAADLDVLEHAPRGPRAMESGRNGELLSPGGGSLNNMSTEPLANRITSRNQQGTSVATKSVTVSAPQSTKKRERKIHYDIFSSLFGNVRLPRGWSSVREILEYDLGPSGPRILPFGGTQYREQLNDRLVQKISGAIKCYPPRNNSLVAGGSGNGSRNKQVSGPARGEVSGFGRDGIGGVPRQSSAANDVFARNPFTVFGVTSGPGNISKNNQASGLAYDTVPGFGRGGVTSIQGHGNAMNDALLGGRVSQAHSHSIMPKKDNE